MNENWCQPTIITKSKVHFNDYVPKASSSRRSHAFFFLARAPAGALNLVLVYDDLGENPSWDRNGTALMAIAQAAAARWERLIPSSGTHTIDVSWSDLR